VQTITHTKERGKTLKTKMGKFPYYLNRYLKKSMLTNPNHDFRKKKQFSITFSRANTHIIQYVCTYIFLKINIHNSFNSSFTLHLLVNFKFIVPAWIWEMFLICWKALRQVFVFWCFIYAHLHCVSCESSSAFGKRPYIEYQVI
jgi:hypothetical protein